MDIEEMRVARSKWFEEMAQLYAMLPANPQRWPLNLPEVMLAFEAGWEAREQAAPFASTRKHQEAL